MKNFILLFIFSAASYNAYSMEQPTNPPPAYEQALAERYHTNPDDYDELWKPVNFGTQPVSSEEKIDILTAKLREAQIWGKRFCHSCKSYQNAIDMRDRLFAQNRQQLEQKNKELHEEIERLKAQASSKEPTQNIDFLLIAAKSQLANLRRQKDFFEKKCAEQETEITSLNKLISNELKPIALE